MKRIVVCADGTWNRPEQKIRKGKPGDELDYPTNILKLARAVKQNGVNQTVFYDWGLGSYHDSLTAGGFGVGINKNIQDGYRFIIQNYNPGDQLYLFGFSRGAYTVRSLAGFIYNCGILKREYANQIGEAFNLYRNRRIKPNDPHSIIYRQDFSHPEWTWEEAGKAKKKIKFIGVYDTVGALGIPFSFLGFLNEKHFFHDNKLGPVVQTARHALAIDEKRDDFRPTIWEGNSVKDLKQVWFTGVHSDVGGSYPPEKGKKELLSDVPLAWLIREAEKSGLKVEKHLKNTLTHDPCAKKNESYKGKFKLMGKYVRDISKDHLIHISVQKRWEKLGYRPSPLDNFLNENGWRIEK